MNKRSKRLLENAGVNTDFTNYVDSVKNAKILENNMNIASEQYRQTILNNMQQEVQQNRADASKYGPFGIIPIMYRGARQMFGIDKENPEVTKARQKAKETREAYKRFTGK